MPRRATHEASQAPAAGSLQTVVRGRAAPCPSQLAVVIGAPMPARGGAPEHPCPRGAARSAVGPVRRAAHPGSDPLGAVRLRAATGMRRGNPCGPAARRPGSRNADGARAAPPVTAPADARHTGVCAIAADGHGNQPRRRDHLELLLGNAPPNALQISCKRQAGAHTILRSADRHRRAAPERSSGRSGLSAAFAC